MSLNNVNNNAAVVNVGRTTPVSPGPQPASKSIPVVLSTDQAAIPVAEQNKIQSEVALSLLGIPRSEVALGIFADVNTYDVNPVEWSFNPSTHTVLPNSITQYSGIPGDQGWGIKHLPEESGALVESPADEVSVLTSKRFFRYQPGRVSSATFGIKSTVTAGDMLGNNARPAARNPAIRKFGILDKFDGYYWETRDTGQDDQMAVVRRTQSIQRYNPLAFGSGAGQQLEDHALAGKPAAADTAEINAYPKATTLIVNSRFDLVEDSLVSNPGVKCRRDVGKFIDGVTFDITTGSNYNATFQALAESNSAEYPLDSGVVSAITSTKTALLGYGDANADTRVNSFFDTVTAISINDATRVIKDSATQAEQIAFLKAVTFPNPTNATTSQIAVKDKLVANRDFITAEINAWVNVNYPTHNHSETKCTRDVLFVLNAVSYDMLYGGNSATYDAAKFFFYDGFAKTTDEHKAQTVAAYNRLVSIIDDIVAGNGISKSSGNAQTQVTSGNNATNSDPASTAALAQVIASVVENGVLSLPNTRTVPVVTWAEASYTSAKSAIDAARETIINTIVPSITLSAEEAKCRRDSKYFIEGCTFDITTGSNFYATFHGLAESNSAEYPLNSFVVDSINTTNTVLLAYADSTADTSINNFFTRVKAVCVDEGTRVTKNSVTQAEQIAFLKGVTYTNPTTATTSQIAVKDKLVANRDFITAEINAWVNVNYPTHNHSETKCTRDVLFAINAVAYDMLYGGNMASYDVAKFFFYDGFAKTTAEHKAQTVAAYTRLVAIIPSIVQGIAITPSAGNAQSQVTSGNNATNGDPAAAAALAQIIPDVITNGKSSLPRARTKPVVTWAAASYTNAKTAIENALTTIITTIVPTPATMSANDLKCLRDMDFVIDAYVNDLKYGGTGHTATNATTYRSALLLDPAREAETHAALRDNIIKLLRDAGETEASTRIYNLSAITIAAFNDVPSTAVESFYTEMLNIAGGGTANGVVYTAPYGTTASKLAIKNQLQRNKLFIQTEINAWVDDPAQGSFGHTTESRDKCTRDVGYIIDALCYDTLYGGNTAMYNVANFFWNNGVDQSGTTFKAQTIAAYGRLKTIVGQIVQAQSVTVSAGNTATQFTTDGTASGSDATALQAVVQTFIDVLTNGIGSLPAKVNPSITWAASDLQAAKNSIASNASSIITDIVSNIANEEEKCRRDVRYFIEGVTYDITTGSNYNATFLALAESNSAEYPLNTNVTTAVNNTQTALLGYGDPTADSRINSFFSTFNSIAVNAGTRVTKNSTTQTEQIAFLKAVTFADPSTATTSQIAVKNKILANRDFITAEINAWVDAQFPTHNHSVAKCTRDVLFVTNAFAYDILYGGNSATYDAAKFFFYDGFAKTTDIHKTQTISAYTRLVAIIDDIVKGVLITKSENNLLSQDITGNNADAFDAQDTADLAQVIANVIQNGTTSLPSTRVVPDVSWAAASYTGAKSNIDAAIETIVSAVTPSAVVSQDKQTRCTRDLGYIIDGLGWDVALGTNYNAVFLGHAESNSIDFGASVIATINSSKSAILALPAVSGQPNISTVNWANRPKIDTIFSVYNKYLGYLVSESMAYTIPSPNPEGYTETKLKFKCLRDVSFVVNGYASDLQYGGNAGTIYNAKKYYSNGSLVVATQTVGGVVGELSRHQYLKNLIGSSSSVTIVKNGVDTDISIDSVLTLFGLTNYKTAFDKLADTIISNFTTEYQGIIDFGSAAQFGDLVILRDGLIMTHAAVFDPSLLKPKKKTLAKVDVASNSLAMAEGSVIIGQYVNYYGNAGGLTDGKTYYVVDVQGPKENIIVLADPYAEDFPNTITPIDITSAGTVNYIETPVPFVFPKEYETAFEGGTHKYSGMFPYMYSSTGTLPADINDSTIGYIDTGIDTSINSALLQEQIDALNLTYKSWVRDHVDPKYYSVYEWRVPRSRFSGDSLDGSTRPSVYSDNVLDKRAGANYIVGGEASEQTSVWDFDFTKVSMLKIEFSWYGAVGALFLAYVPVGNGEARWVRIHHLRCSNQLKISSLGNATLPITYLVYGGGSSNRFGVPNADRLATNYNSYSQFIVKYGASYYIDGGDRGTVRLFNHSSNVPTEIYGSRYNLTIDSTNAADPYSPYFDITGYNGAPTASTYYMNAKVITGNSQDQNVKIIWIDAVANRMYLNKPISQVSSLSVIVDRPTLIFGLKTKSSITSSDKIDVRNRVQVYPTRLSVGSSGSTNSKLTLLKTPTFQLATATTDTLTTTSDVNLTTTNLIPASNVDYLSENGDSIYGYFRGYLNGANNFISILGRLTKINDLIYFYPYEVYNGSLVILSGSEFLKEGIFDAEGNALSATETTFEKARLSSVNVSERAISPIPGTGTEIASYYVSPGAQDFDLSTYFDYNKEYISYPLTDAIETLYLSSYSNGVNSPSSLMSISASLTWEEQ